CILTIIIILLFIIINSKTKNKKSEILLNENLKQIKEEVKDSQVESPLQNALKEVNLILDECTVAYLNKDYSKAVSLYNKAREKYEILNLKDDRTKERFFVLYEKLKNVY
ncbi:MAG: hypothetical protein QW273_02590, partial [Candidatus Pacearchaeota archaeon]